jgi:hypothetical protein
MQMNRPKEQPRRSPKSASAQFQPGDAAAFRRLNEEWITRFFRIEPKEGLVDFDLKTPGRVIRDRQNAMSRGTLT